MICMVWFIYKKSILFVVFRVGFLSRFFFLAVSCVGPEANENREKKKERKKMNVNIVILSSVEKFLFSSSAQHEERNTSKYMSGVSTKINEVCNEKVNSNIDFIQ